MKIGNTSPLKVTPPSSPSQPVDASAPASEVPHPPPLPVVKVPLPETSEVPPAPPLPPALPVLEEDAAVVVVDDVAAGPLAQLAKRTRGVTTAARRRWVRIGSKTFRQRSAARGPGKGPSGYLSLSFLYLSRRGSSAAAPTRRFRSAS